MELYNEENASPTITNIFELKRQEGLSATKLTLEEVETLAKNLN